MMKQLRIYSTAIIVIVLLLLYWAWSHSYIAVTTSGNTGNITYSFTNKDSGKVTKVNSGNGSIKKLLARGDYNVSVNGNSKGYIALNIKAKGFLSTTHLNANMTSEKARHFVGNEPDACMSYIGSTLISYDCYGDFSQAKVHVPGTADLTTYSDSLPNMPSEEIEGIVNQNGQSYAVLYGRKDQNSAPSHQIYLIDKNLGIANGTEIAGLSSQKAYLIKPSDTGFIAYQSDLSQIFSYSVANSLAVAVTMDKPNDKNLTPKTLDVRGSSIVTLYANDTSSEAIINENGHSMHLSFSNAYSDARLCGSGYLCLLTDNKILDVYRLNGSQAQFSFSLPRVIAVKGTSSGFLVVTQEGVLNLNLSSQSGYYEYTFGDYKFNNLQSVDSTHYLLSLTDNKNRVVVLLIDQSLNDSDSIDKKVAQLQKNSFVNLISTYENHIIIVANLGQSVYDKNSKIYIDNPTTKTAAAKSINGEIDALGINRKTYSITSNAF